MKRCVALLAVLCLLLCIPTLSLATEADAEAAFSNPTRDPNAPSYNPSDPGALTPDQIVAQAFVLARRTPSGLEVILERNMNLQRYPASTTKILTALLVLQMVEARGISLDETITVSENARNIPDDASRVPFRAGEVITLRDALYGMMLVSGNEAANALAEYVSGDISSFVALMNSTLEILGCENSFFTNPHGYHDPAHQTTAMDLARMLDTALSNQTFREIIATESYSLEHTQMNPAREIKNSNLHIRTDNEDRYYPYSIGGKTGFHSDAGYVLVEAAEKNGIELIAVAMYTGVYSRWPDTSWLFQYGFEQFESTAPEEIYNKNPLSLQLIGFSLEDTDVGNLPLTIRAQDSSREIYYVNSKEVIAELEENYTGYTSIEYAIEARAPVTQGDVVGTITFFPDDGSSPATYDLLAGRSIAARENAPPTLEDIERMVEEDPSPFPPFDWDWVLPPLLVGLVAIILLIWLGRRLFRRRKRGRRIPMPKGRTYT